MELPRRRMYGCEEEDAMTLFRAARSMSSSMYHHDIAAGEPAAAADVLNLYGNVTADICHEHQQARSSRRRNHVDDDVATYDDYDDEIEQAVALRRRPRRRRQQQQQGVAADGAVGAVLVARDNHEVARQNAEAAERGAEAAREHAEVATMASAPPRVAARHDVAAAAHQRDNDGAAEAAGRAHAEIAHLIAEGVAEVARLRAEVAWSSDVAAAGVVMSFAAALFAPFLMAALLYYILP